MNLHTFECNYTCSCGNRIHWSGTWERVCIENELVTIQITGNGRIFDAILAQSSYGDFICIPSCGIGFSIENLSDTVYLEEHLMRNLSQKDAITIAEALRSMESDPK